MKRKATKTQMLVAAMQSAEEMANSTSVRISGTLRPYLSLSGPMMSWPNASPSMLVVRPSWTVDGAAEKASVMEGSAGRYISVTNGAKAVSAESMMSRNKLGLSVIWLSWVMLSRKPAVCVP